MKISEMTLDQSTEAVIRISTPISNICDDPEMIGLMDELQSFGDMPLFTAVGKLLPKIVTYALQKHRNDFYEIIGALQMIPTSEVGELNLAETIRMVRESYDDILSGFFASSVASVKKRGKKS